LIQEGEPLPKRTFNRLDDDKKERVIRAAIEEFQARGFENAKIEAIARNAEVAKGSIYQYFDDKKELFIYSVTWTLEYFMKIIDRQTPLQDMDVYDYFLSGSRERFELLKQEPLLVAFSMDIYTGKFGGLALEATRELSRIGEEYELKLIANGRRKGTVRDDLDDKTLLLFFQGVTEKFDTEIMEKVKSFDYNPTEEHYREMENLLKNMISLLKQGMGRN
jgi:AcrR family transcriptional regulator